MAGVLGGLAALGGCAGTIPDETRPVVPVAMETRHDRSAGLVQLLDRCPVTGGPQPTAAGLGIAAAAALVPVAVDLGVSAVKDYLARLQSERTGNWIASGAGLLRPGEWCLVVLRGRIGSAAADGTPPLPRQGSLPGNLGETTHLSAPPDFYLEAGLSVTARGDRRELVLEPRLLHFARTAALRGRDETKALGLVLVLRGTPLPARTEAAARENAEAVFALDLGAVRPGTEILRAGSADPFANLRQVAVIRAPEGSMNFAAFVTEAGTPDEVLRLVNATMARQGDALIKALSEAIQAALKESGR